MTNRNIRQKRRFNKLAFKTKTKEEISSFIISHKNDSVWNEEKDTVVSHIIYSSNLEIVDAINLLLEVPFYEEVKENNNIKLSFETRIFGWISDKIKTLLNAIEVNSYEMFYLYFFGYVCNNCHIDNSSFSFAKKYYERFPGNKKLSSLIDVAYRNSISRDDTNIHKAYIDLSLKFKCPLLNDENNLNVLLDEFYNHLNSRKEQLKQEYGEVQDFNKLKEQQNEYKRVLECIEEKENERNSSIKKTKRIELFPRILKWATILCCVGIIIGLAFAINALLFTKTFTSPIVYITDTGDCYHSSDCSWLFSKHATTLAQAKAMGLTACQHCHPGTNGYKTVTEGNFGLSLAISFIACLFLLFYPVLSLFSFIDDKTSLRVKNYEKVIDDKAKEQSPYITINSVRKACGVPDDVRFNERYIPTNDKYFVYAAITGKYYHSNPVCKKGSNLIRMSIFEIRDKEPCPICGKEIIIPKWYKDFMFLINKLKSIGYELNRTE